MTFKERMLQERRLCILKILQETGLEMAHRQIRAGLRDEFSHHISEDVMKADLAWLADLGLVACEDLGADVIVSTLTARGSDVAEGVAIVPGIKRATAWES